MTPKLPLPRGWKRRAATETKRPNSEPIGRFSHALGTEPADGC